MALSNAWTTGGTTQNPWAQQVKSAYQGVQDATGQAPQMSGQINRISPEEESSAYNTAYGGLASDSNFGQLSDEQVKSYYDLANPYMFQTGMEGINQQLAAAGFAPSGSGGNGPQAELAARLQSQLGVQEANSLLQNASTGATAQANAKLGIGNTRYAALSKSNPISFSTGGQGGQGGGTQVKQSQPTTGWSGGGAVTSQTAGGSPWWQTSYGAMGGDSWNPKTGWNATQPGYYGKGDDQYGNYLNQNKSQGGYYGNAYASGGE